MNRLEIVPVVDNSVIYGLRDGVVCVKAVLARNSHYKLYRAVWKDGRRVYKKVRNAPVHEVNEIVTEELNK